MTNYIDELKNIGSAVQPIYKAAEAMDNLAPLDTWRGNTHEEIRNVLISLAEAAHITTSTLTGDLGATPQIKTRTFLEVLAESTMALTNFYAAAVRDEAKATNLSMLEESFEESHNLDDSWHCYAHSAICSAVSIYPELVSALQTAEFRARRQRQAKENYRESALKAEKQVEDLKKENQRLRKLIAHAEQEQP